MNKQEALQALKNDPELLIELEKQLNEKAKTNPDNPKIKKLMDELSPLFKGSKEKGESIRQKLEKQEGPGIERELAKVEPGFNLGAHATALKRGLASTVAAPEDIAGMAAAVGSAGQEERDWLAGPKRAWGALKGKFDLSPVGEFIESPSVSSGIRAGMAMGSPAKTLSDIPGLIGELGREFTIGDIQGFAPDAAELAALEQASKDETSMQRDPTSAFTETLGTAALGALAGKAGGSIGKYAPRHLQSMGRKARNIEVLGVKPFEKLKPPPLPVEETLAVPKAPKEHVVTNKMIEESLPAPGSREAIDIELEQLKQRLAKEGPTSEDIGNMPTLDLAFPSRGKAVSAPPFDPRELEATSAPPFDVSELNKPPSMLGTKVTLPPVSKELEGKFDSSRGAFVQTPEQLNKMADVLMEEVNARRLARENKGTKDYNLPQGVPPEQKSVFENRDTALARAKTVGKKPAVQEPTKTTVDENPFGAQQLLPEAPKRFTEEDPFFDYRRKHVPEDFGSSTGITDLQRLLADYNARFGPKTVKLPPKK